MIPRNSVTGKSLLEAFILASTNPQYDKRLFNELQVQYMKIQSSEHGENMFFPCSTKIRASDKDLPVIGDGSTTAGCVAKGDEPKMEAPVD